MTAGSALPERPASNWRAAASESRTPRWELDAALAVLERAREDLASLWHEDACQQERHIAERRLQSAERLVERITGMLPPGEAEPIG